MGTEKYLIGIDVGFAKMGISAFLVGSDGLLEFLDARYIETIKATKASKTRVDSDNIRRVQELTSQILDFIGPLQGVFVAAEFPTAGSQNASAAYAFGLGTGMLASLLYCHQFPFEHVTPDEVKITATGRRQKVDKIDVEIGMEKIMCREGILFNGASLCTYLNVHFNAKDKREHIADSVASAWWAYKNSNNFRVFIS